jgi:hypothetical protein
MAAAKEAKERRNRINSPHIKKGFITIKIINEKGASLLVCMHCAQRQKPSRFRQKNHHHSESDSGLAIMPN